VAEPAVVNDPVLVVAFDPWARSVAAMISTAADPASIVLNGDARTADTWVVERSQPPRLGVLVMSGPRSQDQGTARTQERGSAITAALETNGVTSLTVERDGPSIWVGPTIVPGRPGCYRCWQARRRQHAEALSGGLAPLGPDGPDWRRPAGRAADLDAVRLGARTAVAVMRRVLEAPDIEAGVVRRFAPDGVPPLIGRVVAVSGCARCDHTGPRRAGWSLRSRPTADAATPTREEVKS
jgi:hypothetical protein